MKKAAVAWARAASFPKVDDALVGVSNIAADPRVERAAFGSAGEVEVLHRQGSNMPERGAPVKTRRGASR
jgi:hypothetical protein